MGRRSTIRNTPLQPRVDLLLDQGIPAVEIARRMTDDGFTVSLPAIYRYAASRRSTLARVFQGETTPMDVAERLVALADAARATRQAAVASGSAAAAARAIQTETSILGKLADLDVDPRTFRDLHAEVHGFAVGIRHLVDTRPAIAHELADALAEKDETRDLARAILGALTPVGDPR